MEQQTVTTPTQNGDGDAARAAHHDEQLIPTDLPKPGNITIAIVAVVFVLLLAALFVIGWIPHHHRAEEARADAQERQTGVPVVTIARPKSSAATKDVVLPADVRPNQETAIFPRASGYLKTLKVDLGDRVEAGQLMAEIDTPEVDAQLAESKATLEQSKAAVGKAAEDMDLAKRTFERFQDLVNRDTGGVTQQELDEKRSAYNQSVASVNAAKATVVANEAAVQRLTVLQGFEKVTAPFAGIVSARNFDVGALLSNNGNKELFRIVQSDPMRVFVNVPQTYATQVRNGNPAHLTVRNYPGRKFEGTVARWAGAIDPNTRTLPVELHFPNPDGALVAGMYGEVRLGVTEDQPLLTIPTSALVFNAEGLRVAVVTDGKTHFKPINVGRDLGTEIEITSGLSADDQVVTNPGTRIGEGSPVQIFTGDQKDAGDQKMQNAERKPSSARDAAG